MRRCVMLCILAVAACSTNRDARLADFHGTWKNESMPETSDSVIARYDLWLPADTAQWKMKFEHQADTIAVRLVSLGGDSLSVHTGPYKSALRPDVMVETETVYRIQNGKLIGRAVAHYNISTPDSVKVVRSRGTRVR